MCAVQWTQEETIVAIVLNMWGVRMDTIATLLTKKSATLRGTSLSGPTPYTRTSGAVSNRFQRYREHHPNLWQPDLGKWNSTAVCDFLLRPDLDKDLIIALLSWTDSDVELIKERAEVDRLRPIESYSELIKALQALGISHLSDTLSAALGLGEGSC